MAIIAKPSNLKNNFANFFGVFGYLSILLQWTFVATLYYSFIKALVLFFNPNSNNKTVEPEVIFDSRLTTIFIVVAVIITIIMVGVSIYTILKAPLVVIKTSEKVVTETAKSITPFILKAQHRKDTKKNQIILTSRIIFIIKVLLIIIPIILTFYSQFLKEQMIEFDIAMFVGNLMASISIIFFIFQYIIASLLKLKRQDLW